MTMLEAYAFAVALAVVIGAAVEIHDRQQRDKRRLRQSVHDNLDSAYVNGYFEPGGELGGMSADEIAHDMACYACDHEGNYYTQDIGPWVREWMQSRGLA